MPTSFRLMTNLSRSVFEPTFGAAVVAQEQDDPIVSLKLPRAFEKETPN